LKKLARIEINTIPRNTGTIIEPCVEIMKGENYEMIWTNNPHYVFKDKKQQPDGYVFRSYKANKDTKMVIDISSEAANQNGVTLCGDIFFRFVNSKNKKQICRCAINTSFVDPETNTYRLDKKSVDPDSIIKSKEFDNDFQVILKFEDVCQTCTAQTPLGQLCQSCTVKM